MKRRRPPRSAEETGRQDAGERDSAPPVGDDAVRKATGRGWEEWGKALDAAGVAKLTHREIAARVAADFPEVSGWWAQMVTVGYERMRGLRATNERADGWSVSVSRTYPVAVDALWNAWAEEAARVRWLGRSLTIRRTTPPKSLRGGWSDGSPIEVRFTAKGEAKSQVTVDQLKLAGPEKVEETRA